MNRQKKSTALILTIGLGIAIPLLIYNAGLSFNAVEWGRVSSGKLKDENTTLVYLPSGMEIGHKYPHVFALSPGADAQRLITVRLPIAEKHHRIIAASKLFSKGIDFIPSL